jgi:hypothetical protein
MAFSDALPGSGGPRIRLAGKRPRRPTFLLGIVSVLVFALVATYLSMGSSQAANASMDVRWQPEDVNVVQDGSNCSVTVNGNVAGTISVLDTNKADVRAAGDNSAEHAADVSEVLGDIPPQDVGKPSDQFGDLVVTAQPPSANYMFPAGVSMAVDCALVNEAVMNELQAVGTSQDSGSDGTVRADALPAWSKGALGAVAGAAVFLAVSIAVTAAVVALGFQVVPSAPMSVGSAAIASMAGCIGGAASTAVTLYFAGAGSSWEATLSNTVSGCITGGSIALLPIKDMGTYIGTAIRSMFVGGDVAAAIGGSELSEIIASRADSGQLSEVVSAVLSAASEAASTVASPTP